MKKVLVCDSSLKIIGLGGTGVLSFKEKLEIAKRLNELCVDVIEVSPSANAKADEILIKTISNCITKSVVSCTAGLTEAQAEANYALIAGAKRKRLNVVMPVSPIQMEYVLGKKPAIVLELLKTLTKKAVSLCDDVEVTFDDATRAEPDFLYDAVRAAIDCGAKTVSVSDIAGTMLPQEFSEFIEKIRANVVELAGVKLLVGASNVLDMGTANAVSAIIAGADGVKVSALTSDLPSIEIFSAAMENIGAKRGFETNLNKTAIRRIVAGIAEMAATEKDKAAINFTEEKAEALEKNITLGALSKIIRKRGYDLNAEDVKKVYAEFTRLSEKKEVNTKELDVIIAANALQVPETYSLVSFSVSSSNVLAATASIALKNGEETLNGLSFGNGPVDAAFLAIESVTGRHFELDDFDLSAVTEGKEAMGQAVVKLRYNGVIYSGRGISTDIIGASIRAYVAAINKIFYEESKK